MKRLGKTTLSQSVPYMLLSLFPCQRFLWLLTVLPSASEYYPHFNSLLHIKDDVLSVLRSLSPQFLWASRSYSLQTAYLIFEAHFKLFCQQFPWVLQPWRFLIKWYHKEWSIKLRIDNGGWQQTLNWLHVSRCEMLDFVMSYMKQNKSRKQTLWTECAEWTGNHL